MDENLPGIKQGESLPESDLVFRITQVSFRDRLNNEIPAERNFTLSSRDEFKLSVDWAFLSKPEACLARVGASYKFGKEEFKDWKQCELYSFRIYALKELSNSIMDVVYDPVRHETPQKGRPDNNAHALVLISNEWESFEPKLAVKMRDMAVENGKVTVDPTETEAIVTQFRDQWD
ncbi:MAG: hypothetical protein V4543_11905 [Bacteroidota bacterium]